MKLCSIIGIALFVSVITACGGGTSSSPSSSSSSSSSTSSSSSSSSGDSSAAQIERGKSVYENPIASGNAFACASCHAIKEPANDGFARAGHQIGDALRRASFKNGQLSSFLDAANSCLDEWMVSNELWTEQSPDYQDLRAFLESEDSGQGEAPAINYALAQPLDTDNLQGDAVVGEALFNQSCAICHGIGGGGTQQGPSLLGRSNASVIARKVRASGNSDSAVYDGLIGGVMPFFAADRLDDDELEDIIAFIQTTVDNSTNNGGSSGGNRDCPSTHPKVGQTAQLINRGDYAVSGSVTIVDDCTLRFDNFSYDGRGILVQIFGGTDGVYRNNFIVMDGVEDLRRSTPYVNESFSVNVPEGNTLDDFNGVSVWCVGIGTSFGDGLFE